MGRWDCRSFVHSMWLKDENWLEGHCLKMMGGQLVMETDLVPNKKLKCPFEVNITGASRPNEI